VQRALYAQAKTSPIFGPPCAKARYLVRKSGAGDRHARFDERDLETGHFGDTAPDLDSTRRGGKDAGYAADGTLAGRAVAGLENMAAQAGRTGNPGN
jgi:hypothetical protein